ncbi:MAG: alpha/beta hydrolase [Pseudomonadota bacterium]
MTSFLDTGGEGPTLVCLHGLGSGKEGFKHQLAAAQKYGWRCVSIDAPGFGETPQADAQGFAPHVDIVVATLNELGISKAAILGHSMGGMTAQEIYATHPERVSALILSATSPAFGRPDGDFQKAFVKARFEPFDNGMSMEEFAEQFAGGLVGKTAGANIIEEIRSVMCHVPIPAYRQAVETIVTFDRRNQLPDIKAPTLLIAGEEDRNSPAPMMEKMAGKIPGSQFIKMSGVGHMANLEEPDGFNHHLFSFLNSLESVDADTGTLFT